VSESDNGALTRRLGGKQSSANPRSEHQHQATQKFATQRVVAEPKGSPQTGQPLPAGASTRRWNLGRDLAAAVLLLAALVFPWNLYFGGRIPNSRVDLFALLVLTTLLSLASVAATYAGSWGVFGARSNPVLLGRLRLALNVPYLLLVLAFIGFDVVQTVRYGGSVKIPGGVGPGAWLGIAGSLLSAQPVITGTAADDDRFARWLASARIVGYASIAGAALSFLFNLHWRVKYALPRPNGSSDFGKENVAVITTAVAYGVVTLAAVLVASRWIVQRSKPSRLVAIVVGASTVAAGIIVWSLPIGREIDAFHGIAQNTSTAGPGFEGYFAWVAAAAIFAPLALLVNTRLVEKGVWQEAARKGLLLIVVWCTGSVVMRITDLLVAVSLNYPFSRYNGMALATFDLVTAVLAVWLRVNLTNRSLPVRLVSALCGLLFMLTISRVVVGIALAPRFAGSPRPRGPEAAVYGNNLAQQITSTFDVMLCGLALCILAVVIIRGRVMLRPRPRATANGRGGIRSRPPAAPPTADAETTRLRGLGSASQPPWVRQAPQPRIHRPTAAPTRQMAVGTTPEDATRQLATGTPQIHRSDDSRRQSRPETPKIYRVQEDSVQHSAAQNTDEGHHRR
jgi:hypothetical protein